MSAREDKRAVRRQADILSVRALADLLRSVASNPATYMNDLELQSALRSQGGLAKHDIPTSSVHSMSLNHQRLIADLAVGGFDKLDQLRRAALDALTAEKARAKRGNARSKEGLLARVKELESDLALLKHDLVLLQRAYDLRCQQARNYASSAGSSIQALCVKEQKEIDATFSLRKKNMEPSNVVPIGAARK